MCGVNAMYDIGKILAAGGTPQYDDTASVTTTYLITVPNVGQQASVEKVSDLKYPRAFANNVVLPDGTVMVLGGQWRSRQFTDIESVIYPELYDPKIKSWRVLNAEAKPRNYHSSAVLLGDGTVFSGGGGLCWVAGGAPDNSWGCDPSAQHMDAEIFSPPYLFNSDGSAAVRPSISSLTTSTDTRGNWVRAGGTLTATMGDTSATTFSLVRLGSSTHSVNTDQRRISLSATQSGRRWSIKLPSDSGVVLPGYWFLFALNGQGTPSIARVVQVRL
jgi:galactose oxidase